MWSTFWLILRGRSRLRVQAPSERIKSRDRWPKGDDPGKRFAGPIAQAGQLTRTSTSVTLVRGGILTLWAHLEARLYGAVTSTREGRSW